MWRKKIWNFSLYSTYGSTPTFLYLRELLYFVTGTTSTTGGNQPCQPTGNGKRNIVKHEAIVSSARILSGRPAVRYIEISVVAVLTFFFYEDSGLEGQLPEIFFHLSNLKRIVTGSEIFFYLSILSRKMILDRNFM
jgi:hypothetical protein